MTGPKKLPSTYEFCLAHTRADRNLRNIVSKQLSNQQLNVMEWLALKSVQTSPNNSLNMSQISEQLDVTLPQITALINQLSDAGLVKQKTLSADKRSRQVSVTLRGRRTLQKLESKINSAVNGWTQKLSANQFRAYADSINKLAKKI